MFVVQLIIVKCTFANSISGPWMIRTYAAFGVIGLSWADRLLLKTEIANIPSTPHEVAILFAVVTNGAAVCLPYVCAWAHIIFRDGVAGRNETVAKLAVRSKIVGWAHLRVGDKPAAK